MLSKLFNAKNTVDEVFKATCKDLIEKVDFCDNSFSEDLSRHIQDLIMSVNLDYNLTKMALKKTYSLSNLNENEKKSLVGSYNKIANRLKTIVTEDVAELIERYSNQNTESDDTKTINENLAHSLLLLDKSIGGHFTMISAACNDRIIREINKGSQEDKYYMWSSNAYHNLIRYADEAYNLGLINKNSYDVMFK